MNKLLYSTVLGVLMLGFSSCKKTETIDPPLGNTCKLTQIDRGNGNKHSYEYNVDGSIAKMTIHFRGATATEPEEVYEYTFSYNTNKQITGATIKLNGQKPTQLTNWGVGDAVSFTWSSGGQLTKVTDLLGSKAMLTTTVTYDGQGRVTSLKGAPDPEWGEPFEKTFTYDAQHNLRYVFLENDSPVYYEEVTVDNTLKSAESLLIERGLPYDIFNTAAWRTHVTRELKGYEVDGAGKAILTRTLKAINTITNTHKIATEQVSDDNGKQRTMTFTLSDCQ